MCRSSKGCTGPHCLLALPCVVQYALLFLILLSQTTEVSCRTNKGICHSSTDKADLKEAVHYHALPKAQKNAGDFLPYSNASHLLGCILQCCHVDYCQSVLYHNNSCLLIQCNTSLSGACDPMSTDQPKFENTTYVEVKPLEYTDTSLEANLNQDLNSCDPQTHKGCPINEQCHLVESFSLSVCLCKEGFVRDKKTHACVAKTFVCEVGLDIQCPKNEVCEKVSESSNNLGECVCREGFFRNTLNICEAEPNIEAKQSPSTSTVANPLDTHLSQQVCEFGLNNCAEHQECFIPENSKRRSGLCVCVQGFEMNEEGECIKNGNDQPVPSSTKIPVVASTPIPVAALTVSAGENKTLQLPEDSITLNAFVMEQEKEGETFLYEWKLLESPKGAEIGTMEFKNTKSLKLTKLIAGVYTFQFKVTGDHREGSSEVNVTVLPPKRINQPPVAVIKPPSQVVKLPNNAILDGSDSTDDDKIVKYHWEEVSGPIQGHQISDDNPLVTLKDLAAGIYQLKLTVTDSDGATNSAMANVTVIKETDYPPKANAGSDMVIFLPQTSVILCGNSSTDDKGITSYEWIKAGEATPTADMAGVRSPCLNVSNLQLGDYTFTLTVRDESEQFSSADVHVFVKPAVNKPPVAVTDKTLTIKLPQPYIPLIGNKSTDDSGIMSYLWETLSGPTTLELKNKDQAVAQATGSFVVGEYNFRLTVADKEGLKATDDLLVIVKQDINKPPIANAGGNHVITWPRDLVYLNGSGSTDDLGIVKYTWARDKTSLAAGDVVEKSENKPVLMLVNLVPGRYVFTLTVMDKEGLSDTDSATIEVKDDPNKLDALEIVLDADIRHFTEEDKVNLQHQLSLMLPKSHEGDKIVHTHYIEKEHHSGKLRVVFHVKTVGKDYQIVDHGLDTLQVLKKQIKESGYHILNFHVTLIDTLVCQKNCSDHGHCDMQTKLCICETFWMQNIFTYFSDEESNCDWSILYVIVVSFSVVVLLTILVWATIVYCRGKRFRCKWKSKKRRLYSLLRDEEFKDEVEMIPKGKIQNSSMMISESDFSSDEETLFINHKKSNGFKPVNGLNKTHLKTKLRT